MMNRKRLFWATTALTGALVAAGAASAQSTGTEATEVQEVVVTGARGPRTTDGSIVAETVTKTRSSVTQEFISRQAAGQTILQTLNLTPGLNFTNADPYGSSGGNIRLRGFDGNRVSLTFDGIPLNDTGNYATYTNQQLDPELIERASVNTGTTDVDSPTASATGGTINYTTRRPAADFGGWLQASGGSFNYRRFMGLIDTGEIGPWGTSAWFAVSDQTYDKFKGLGELNKTQYNFRIYQPVGDNGDFVALSGHYNENRNNSYLGPNLGTATGFCDVAQTQVCVDEPFDTDFTRTYNPVPVRPGVADVDPSSNNNYYGLRINPSNTGNVRLNSRFTLAEGLIFTFDPSFQYTLANGGTQNTVLAENSSLLRGTQTTGGVDLNGDGDILDQVRVMNPSNTNTHRYGVNSSLIWNLNDDHQLRAAYTLDWGRHRQTGDYGYIDFSDPSSPRFVDEFGGRNDHDNRVVNLDGFALQARNRLSYAMLNQFAAEYRGNFMNDAVTVNIGVRAPFFERELNQYCYSQNASSNVLCTSQVPNATLANGNVTFAGSSTQYIAPYEATKKFDDILPNVGAVYRFGQGQSVYASYAESLSAPRTDSLYTVVRLPDGSIGNPTVQPETSQNFELGYRLNAPGLIIQAAAYRNQFDNRIVNTYDEDLGTFVDRNVGSVETMGIDASVGWEPIERLSLYASASFLDSELQDDYVLNATGQIAATKGKELVETPSETFALRAAYDFNDVFSAGIQGKYVGERWVTDVNDLKVDAYTVVDLDARFDFAPLGFEGTYLQFNVTNLFDEEYFVNLGTRTSATPGQPGYSRPFAGTGPYRTVMATLRYAF
ncbi:MAG: TonB-dependent receptor [Brevundimonas sp.]|uniref:TonB-dependent receptor n=2 Tax=Caulobacteraceae TaxID=76892 RepID=A0ABY4SQF7_9CAUL|nr:TonB-dependent receptor [Brevundimonas albigilva]PZU59246.1 MAG: TonB-dependent receptor [Brevundimonas sp.]URI14920.1 TonB-dependent receptor [Brevundimonas albigilva]